MQLYCKKIKFILFAMIILLTGCSKKNIEDNTTNNVDNVEYVYDKNTEISKSSRMAFGEKGYYYLTNGILYFYETSNDVSIAVCSKTNCLHNDSECDAYAIDKDDYDPYDLTGITVDCLGNSIWYGDGKLYMIKRDEAGDYLMQYDDDFTNEVKLTVLAENGSVLGLPSSYTEGTALLYDGYLYYFSVKPTKASELIDYVAPVFCNRVKLEKNAQVEVLGSFEMAIDYNLFGHFSYGEVCAGNGAVYFVAGGTHRQLSETDIVQYRICYYDCSKGNFTVILNKNSNNTMDVLGTGTGRVKSVKDDIACVDDENNVYISTGDKAIVKITPSGNSEVIYSNSGGEDISSLIWDGSYVYFYEEHNQMGYIIRLDKHGNVKGRYNIIVNHQFCKEKNISGTLSADIVICGIDAQNIIVSTEASYIKGLECEKELKGTDYNYIVRSCAVGIISKKAFEDPSLQIKSIYKKD